MNPRIPGALLAAALAGSAAAQAPQVSFSLLADNFATGLPTSLPAGQGARTVAFLAPGRVIMNTTQGRTFVGDGSSLTEVCVAGTQIPGQAAGVVWGGAMNSGHVFNVPGRGALFTMTASGPGIGSPAVRSFLGDPATGPFWMNSSTTPYSRCTPSGLIASVLAQGELRVGPVDGVLQTLVPPGFVPPGLSSPITRWNAREPLLDNHGVALGVAITSQPSSVLGVVDQGGFHTVLVPNQVVHTDRGDYTLTGSFGPALEPLEDGSFLLTARANSSTVTITWLADRSGNGTMFMREGDPAPGGTADETIGNVYPLAARNGRILWGGSIINGGVEVGAAVYLWSSGRHRLLLRDSSPVAGAPDGAPALRFGATNFTNSTRFFQLNQSGDVSMFFESAFPSGAAYLYSARAGTVEILRVSQNLSIGGVTGTLTQIRPAFGTFSSVWFNSGGVDERLGLLDPDGAISFAGELFSPPHNGTFAATARITSHGCRPDYNADGFLDFFDYDAFLECFEGGACANGKDADFNNDDFADFFDLIDYVDAFEAGC